MTGSEIYVLNFTREMYDVPILHRIGKKFRVTLTLRRAMLSEDAGWAEVKLTGAAEEIGRAVAELQTTGVSVTGPLETVIESDIEPAVAGVGRGT